MYCPFHARSGRRTQASCASTVFTAATGAAAGWYYPSAAAAQQQQQQQREEQQQKNDSTTATEASICSSRSSYGSTLPRCERLAKWLGVQATGEVACPIADPIAFSLAVRSAGTATVGHTRRWLNGLGDPTASPALFAVSGVVVSTTNLVASSTLPGAVWIAALSLYAVGVADSMIENRVHQRLSTSGQLRPALEGEASAPAVPHAVPWRSSYFSASTPQVEAAPAPAGMVTPLSAGAAAAGAASSFRFLRFWTTFHAETLRRGWATTASSFAWQHSPASRAGSSNGAAMSTKFS